MDSTWQDHKPMTEKQFRSAIMRLGMTINEMQRFLGISQSTVFRYAAGTATIPHATVMLLRLLVERKISVAVVRR